jgi:hypothetical protein
MTGIRFLDGIHGKETDGIGELATGRHATLLVISGAHILLDAVAASNVNPNFIASAAPPKAIGH